MNRIFRNTIFYLFIFLAIIGVVSVFNAKSNQPNNISYDEFIKNLKMAKLNLLTFQVESGVYAVTGQVEGAKEDEVFITIFFLSKQRSR